MINFRNRIVGIAMVMMGALLLTACGVKSPTISEGGEAPPAAPTVSEREYAEKMVPLLVEASVVLERLSQKSGSADSLIEILTLDLSEERAQLRRIIADMKSLQPPPGWEGIHQEAITGLELMEEAFRLTEEGARELDMDKLQLALTKALEALRHLNRVKEMASR